MLSGSETRDCQSTATRSANAPCAAPNTLSPGRKGHPSGIGEPSAMHPASSLPSTNGRGGWFWYLPWDCRIYEPTGMGRTRLEMRRVTKRTREDTHVEIVEACAVDVDEHLAAADLGCRGVLGDRDLGGVGVVGHYKRAHLDFNQKSSRKRSKFVRGVCSAVAMGRVEGRWVTTEEHLGRRDC